MLNKKEKHEVCSLIAQWEWAGSKGDSISGAMARSECSRSLQEAFDIGNDDDDLIFARCMEIQKLVVGATENIELDGDQFLWFLCDLMEDNYKEALDLIETDRNFGTLIQKFKLDFLLDVS